MKNLRLLLVYLLFITAGISFQAAAEDIDIYSIPAASAYNPNILIILDTAANSDASVSNSCVYADGSGAPSIGGKLLGIEQCTLFNLIYNLPTGTNGVGTVNLGIMFYNATGQNCSGFPGGSAGGCLVQPLTSMSVTNKTTILNWIKTWSTGTGGITSNSEATGQTMQEAWAYFAGQTGVSGRNYSGIAPTPGCQKNFVIYIANAYDTNGTPGDGGLGTYSMTTGAPTPPPVGINNAPGVTATPSTIAIPSGNYNSCGSYSMPQHKDSSGLYADEWARYMHQYNLYPNLQGITNITTYGVAALGPSCKPDYPALLTSMALYGGGEYFPTYNAGDMYQALLRILNQIQAVNSVFASSSLPVSVNAQGTFLNQVFMGMFRPDAQANPRWLGNLKQYQFTYNSTTGSLQLADAIGMPAISPAGTGFLDPSADSFWTCTSSSNPKSALAPYAQTTTYSPFCQTPLTDPAPGFWANNVNGVGGAWDLPDGDVVEKGGVAQMLRLVNLTNDYTTVPGSSTNPRKLYSYCPSGTGCIAALSDVSNVFDTSNTAITDSALGTGPIPIASITSAATVQASGTVPSGNGTTATVTITSFSKSGNTVTATVSATDLAKLSVGSQLKIATGATKYDCNPCTVASVNTGNNTFTYSNSGGSGAPTTPYTATIYSNFFTVSSNGNGLSIGQTVTFSGCTVYTGLNNTVATTTAVSTSTFTVATAVSSASTTSDTGCKYTPNTATVTAFNHNLPNGAVVTIAGASPTGYNGSWTIAVTGTNTFTYQYTAAAPLTNFSATGATATSTTTTRDALTKWVRGDDNLGDEPSLCPPGTTAGTGNCPNPAVTIRPSVHGDVLHSRPVVLNYGGVTINITGTSDSGSTRTATASSADVANIGGSSGNVIFANGNTCNVTVTSSTTFTYPTVGCGPAGAQTAATGRPNVVVFYGSNDGTFHAVDGNQPNNSGVVDANAGNELWGFIPSELFGELKRLHDNSPSLLMPSTPSGIIPAPQRKNYSIDGPTGVYQLINGNGTTAAAYIYLSMRRGGRFIYALDVSNPNNPKFLWKHNNTDPGFSELGQTWSQPKVAKVNGYPNPVLIFGAGYDAAAEDAEAPTADTMGRGIFILDAQTGALVWSASPNPSTTCTSTSCQLQVTGMNYSIPSDITLIDSNSDGLIDRLYVGDVGGNVWRVDLAPSANTPNYWQVEKLAALGCSTGPCPIGTTPRKILYPPEVILTQYYDAVFVATGDREHPLWTNTTSTSTNPSPYAISPPYGVSACAVTNRAYMLQDTKTGLNGSGLITITEGNLFDATTLAYSSSSVGYSGYYVTFKQCEKSVNAPLVVAGYVYFGTNQPQAPSSNTCEDSLGEARNYMLAPFSGKYYVNEFEGGGFPPSPVSGVVSVVDSVTGKPMQVPFCIGCGGEENGNCSSNSALAGCKPPIAVSTKRSRTYWYIEGK